MTNPIYATSAELAIYMGEAAPANAAVLLRKASSLVTYAARGTVYDVDANGIPTNALKAAGCSEATSAQAAAWSANDVNPLGGRAAVKKEVAAKSGGGVSVTYASYAADANARSDLASGDVLVPEALRLLDSAGMLSNSVQGI